MTNGDNKLSSFKVTQAINVSQIQENQEIVFNEESNLEFIFTFFKSENLFNA